MIAFIIFLLVVGAGVGFFLANEVMEGDDSSFLKKVGWYLMMMSIAALLAVTGVAAVGVILALMVVFMGITVVVTFFTALSDAFRMPPR